MDYNNTSDTQDTEMDAFAIGIERRVAVEPWLVEALDRAALYGEDLPTLAEMLPFITQYDHPAFMPTSGFDGTVDGVRIDDASALRWCTLRDHYGWAIPTKETVDFVVERAYQRCIIDFGAGTGYLAAVLRAKGLKVITAENGQWRFLRNWIGAPDYLDGYQAILDNPDAIILCSWPDPSINAKKFVDAILPDQEFWRCGAYEFTGVGLSKLCLSHFDQTDQTAIASCTGSSGGGLLTLTKRLEPKLVSEEEYQRIMPIKISLSKAFNRSVGRDKASINENGDRPIFDEPVFG